MRLPFDQRRPSEARVVVPRGPGEQIVVRGECSEHAALHALPDGGEIVGADPTRSRVQEIRA